MHRHKDNRATVKCYSGVAVVAVGWVESSEPTGATTVVAVGWVESSEPTGATTKCTTLKEDELMTPQTTTSAPHGRMSPWQRGPELATPPSPPCGESTS